MSFVLLFGVCVVGAGCFPKKETEAEYKARIRKELDEIPVEATGYKLVDPTKQEVTYLEGENPQREYQTLMIDGHSYAFICKYENFFDSESSLRDWRYYILLSIDDGEGSPVIFSDNKFFEHYNTSEIVLFYYDGKIFIVRYRSASLWLLDYSAFYPPILFYYDIERNAAEYIGYSEAWFDYKIKDLNGNGSGNYSFTIIKT